MAEQNNLVGGFEFGPHAQYVPVNWGNLDFNLSFLGNEPPLHAQGQTEPTSLAEQCVSQFSTQRELGKQYPFFDFVPIGGAIPTFRKWKTRFPERSNIDCMKVFGKLLPTLRDTKRFPITKETPQPHLISAVKRNLNLYRTLCLQTFELEMGDFNPFVNFTSREVLAYISKFPTEMSEGLELFWVIDRGMEWMLWMLKMMTTAFLYINERVANDKFVDFDIKMFDYETFYMGFSVFGPRRQYHESTDEEEIPDYHVCDEDGGCLVCEMREDRVQRFNMHIRNTKPYYKTIRKKYRKRLQHTIRKKTPLLNLESVYSSDEE